MQSRLRSPVFIFGSLVCASLAHAQAPLFKSYDSHQGLLWPTDEWGTAAFTRTAVGEFTGEGLLDVVTLSGAQSVISWNIAHHSFEQLLPTGANDIDTYLNGANPGRDAITFVNASGLGFMAFSEDDQDFATTMIDTDHWLGARRVSCGDIDGDANGTIDFAGALAATKYVIWRLGTNGSDVMINTGVDVLDVALVHWSNAATRDLALLTHNGFQVYATTGPLAGALLYSHQRPAQTMGVVMTVVPAAEESSGLDFVAVIYATTGASPSKQLYVYGHDDEVINNNIWSTVNLPANMTFVGMASGNADGDLDFDLVIAQKRELGPLYLENFGGGHPFVAPSSWLANFIVDQQHFNSDPTLDDAVNDPLRGPDALANVSVPVFTDFTDDGKADLVLALPDTPGVNTVPAHIYLENVTPDSGPSSLSLNFLQSSPLFQRTVDEQSVQLGGYIGFTTGIPAFNPGNANAVRITIHRQANITAEPFNLGYSECVVSLVGALGVQPQIMWVPIEDVFQARADWDLPVTGQSPRREIFWLEVQPLKISLSGAGNTQYVITDSWATRIGAIVSDPRDYCEYLQEQHLTGTLIAGGASLPQNYPGTNWSGVTTTAEINPTCASSGVPALPGPIAAPAVIGRRRLPPGSTGTLGEYPSDTYMSGTISPFAAVPQN